jgi:hypothetical protein
MVNYETLTENFSSTTTVETGKPITEDKTEKQAAKAGGAQSFWEWKRSKGRGYEEGNPSLQNPTGGSILTTTPRSPSVIPADGRTPATPDAPVDETTKLIDLWSKLFPNQSIGGGSVGTRGNPEPVIIASPAQPTSGNNNKAVILILVLVVAGGGYYYYKKHKGGS